MVKDLIHKLLKDLELSKNEILEEEGRYTVSIDQQIAITFNHIEPEGIWMSANIGQCPQRRKEELFTKLMIGNLFGQGTGGAAIAIDGEEKKLLLNLTIFNLPNYPEFYAQVENFLNNVEFWKNELKHHEEESDHASDFFH